MMATLADPIKITLPTNTTNRGQIWHQIATLNLTAHTRSGIGRTNCQVLTDHDITQLNADTPSLHYNHAKGLISKPDDKVA